MNARKPPGESWESWVDRQIREAEEQGEFDDLPGSGRPIPDLDRPYDELWWVRKKLKQEDLSFLPPALQIRKDLEEAHEHIARARSERDVRHIVAAINERIRYVNRYHSGGPVSPVMPLDEEQTVRGWRRRGAGR